MFRSLLFTFCLGMMCTQLASQVVNPEAGSLNFPDLPQFTYGQGLGITSPDSLFQLNIRFRMQNRISFNYDDGDVSAVEGRVRRVRLRFDGFVYTPRIRYSLQLSFANEDIGDFVGSIPNLLRDGMLYYQISPSWTLGMGQTKLPGNRERVNSSGDLQLCDRSSVNNIFNIDRDFGAQVFHQRRLIGSAYYAFKGAISSGEGRNWVSSTGHYLAYTIRSEILPFGEFSNRGDYFQGDLLREPHPRLSLGFTYSYNHGALRAFGQRGELLYGRRNIKNFFADILFKYKGWAISSEFANRRTNDPVTLSTDDPSKIAFVFNGQGFVVQTSYLFSNNYEVVARYSGVKADRMIHFYVPKQSDGYTLGFNKYLRGHRLKAQVDATWFDNYFTQGPNPSEKFWQFRFQVELGI
jgi:phosphate-selective porin OprO/OprP